MVTTLQRWLSGLDVLKPIADVLVARSQAQIARYQRDSTIFVAAAGVALAAVRVWQVREEGKRHALLAGTQSAPGGLPAGRAPLQLPENQET